ncbi:MAG: ThuA domain-containing protein, partial [Planctomycetes bacterium]|nr:ThuA domain-containing protein [Planctomycetota bacterium]
MLRSALAVALILHSFAMAQGEAWVDYPGSDGPGRGKRIVLISGDEEYRSEEALPQLGKILARRHGFDCRVLFAIDPQTGRIDGDVQTNIPGLNALADADLMVIATRFRDLPDEQMQLIDDYLRSGRPVVGIRTATHAFALTSSPTFARYSWNHDGENFRQGFGRQVLGETWIAHHGRHGEQSTRGVVAPGAVAHPIARGLADGDVWGPTDVYRVRSPLPDGCQPVVLGQVLDGMRPDSPPAAGEFNDPMMPIAWTKEHDGSGFGPRRVFTQTIGAATDFVAVGTRRLFVNAVYWAVGLDGEIPESGTDVEIVGSYRPTEFGFGKARRGVRPSDHAFDAVVPPRGGRGLCAPGSRITVVGNTFAERLAQSGAFDAVVHATHPGRKLVIRHAPWSADEVGLRPREHSVPKMLDWLARLDTDVAVLCFGMSESFSQSPDEFETGLRRLVDDVARVGAVPPRIVLVSPIAHEGQGAAIEAHDVVLDEFRSVMRRVASDRRIEFVDLFVDRDRANVPVASPLTTNGIHPNALGCGVFALAIAEQLGWLSDTAGSGGPKTVSAARALRRRAADLHWWFRLRYRPTNTEYVWGRRHEPFGSVNFPPEAAQLDRMLAARDRAIWDLAVPDSRSVAADLVSGEDVWSEVPLPEALPEDEWVPPAVEAKGTETSLGSTDILPPDEFARSFTLPVGYTIECFASELDFP